MTPDQVDLEAGVNFHRLSQNPYPGRGIVAGLDETRQFLVQVYLIMGRSANSRNRILEATEDGRLHTVAADPSRMENPSLIIYNAMREHGRHFIVSNGNQTDTVAEWIGPLFLQAVLSGCEYEPDAPNFTPRITAVSSLGIGRHPSVQMSILRKSMFGDGCERLTYDYRDLRAGLGFCITTHSGDGNPLPAFRGDPLLMPLAGGIEEVAETYWHALNEENRVALAVKFIEQGNGRSDIHIINKYEKVG